MSIQTDMDLENLNQEFEGEKPEQIIRWAVSQFSGRLTMTSSFGPESGVLLHMVSCIQPQIPVLFLETGYHFKETLDYKRQLIELFGLKNVRGLKARPEQKEQLLNDYQGIPYEKNPDLCCRYNKVEPLQAALKDYGAWMSGIRRYQTDFRKSIRIVEAVDDGLYKISPLANFTSRDAWWYLKENKIPQHPLYEKGYLSIGCWPCTRPVQQGDDERTGRWAGKSKKECGIHTFAKGQKPSEEPSKKDKPIDNYQGNI
ncbi:phosphoadenylyl-sulfate reductase [Omnitrophica bacterium]|nr:phosphoadenylyl-sulfate reductase [Candidatus Omnitrophota bacterium]